MTYIQILDVCRVHIYDVRMSSTFTYLNVHVIDTCTSVYAHVHDIHRSVCSHILDIHMHMFTYPWYPHIGMFKSKWCSHVWVFSHVICGFRFWTHPKVKCLVFPYGLMSHYSHWLLRRCEGTHRCARWLLQCTLQVLWCFLAISLVVRVPTSLMYDNLLAPLAHLLNLVHRLQIHTSNDWVRQLINKAHKA